LPYDSAFWTTGYLVAGEGPVPVTVHLLKLPAQPLAPHCVGLATPHAQHSEPEPRVARGSQAKKRARRSSEPL
jgi:hypothetical protein